MNKEINLKIQAAIHLYLNQNYKIKKNRTKKEEKIKQTSMMNKGKHNIE